MEYSFWIGLWKSIKNTAVVLAPAGAAGYAAFLAEAPPEYQPYIMAAAGIFGYLFKNYYQVNKE